MKTAIATLAVALFANFANALPQGNLVAEVKGISMHVGSVQLYEDGTLVAYSTGRAFKEMKLSPSNAQELLYKAQALAEQPVVTTHSMVVCMMMLNPMFNRELTIATGGAMRLTLSAQNCAVANRTAPKEKFAFDMAMQLRDQLAVFGRQLLND